MLLTVFSTVFVRLPLAYWAVGAGWGLKGRGWGCVRTSRSAGSRVLCCC